MEQKNKRNVFVTGASGFVGANLVRTLLKKNYIVHILQRTASLPWRLQNIADQIIIHTGDLTSFDSVKSAVQKAQPNYIFHLAAYGAYHYQTEMDKIVQVNVNGTKNLLEATRDIPYSCFINTGSSSEYGYKKKAMKETDFCDPVSYYAATKLGVTHLCKVFAKQHNKPVATFRLFSVYGPFEEPTRFVPVIMKNLILQKPIQVTPGKQRRDFIYIDDVTKAYLQAMKLGGKLQGEIFNLGTGVEYTNDEIVKKLFSVTNRKTIVDKGAYPKRTWDATHWKADISHTEKNLNWKPIYTIDNGLKTTYSWFENNIKLYQ